MLYGSKLAEQRAKDGAAFLDQRDPGWDKRINLLHLQLSSASHCVLGQTQNGFHIGRVRLGLSTHMAQEYGFLDQVSRGVTYARLDLAWTKLLNDRHEARLAAREAKLAARKAQEEAYATYAENLKYAEGYDQGFVDGEMSEITHTTIQDIADRMRSFLS